MKQKPKVGMLVHNPPFQGGIVQYCILLENHMNHYADYELVGFKKLYPPFLYKGKLPKKSTSGIEFSNPCNNFVTWYNPFSWIKAYNKLKKGKIIHLHWVSPLLAPLQWVILTANRLGKRRKIVLTCHNIEPHESTFVDKIFTKMVFSKVDHFIVHAEQNRFRLINQYKIYPSRVHTIHHGTFGYFTRWANLEKLDARRELGLKDDDKVILFFGYIREYKGLRYLLRAMPEIIKSVPNVKLLIAGELWQDWKTYDDEIKKGMIEEHVKVVPKFIPDKDVHKYFTVSDIMVLPYHNTEQTISGPLLVGLAFHMPIVVSNVGGITEMIKDGKNALIVNGGRPEELSTKVAKLLKDKKLQIKLSEGAKDTDKLFCWKDVAVETAKVYEKVI